MLAKLFGNISLPALVRALALALVTLVASLFLSSPKRAEFHAVDLMYELPVWMYITTFIAVILICGLWLNNAINDLEVLKGNYHIIPLLTWMLVPFVSEISLDLLLSVPLVLLLSLRLISLAGKSRLDYVMFDAGVITGLLVLVVPEAIVFLLFAWLAVIVFRTIAFRVLLMPVVGLIAIWFMIFSVMYFVSGDNLIQYLQALLNELQWEFALPAIGFNAWAIIPLGLVILPAALEMLQLYAKANVFKKQVFNFLILFVLVLLTSAFFVKHALHMLAWLSIPFSIWVANLVIYLRKGWKKDLAYLSVFLFWLISLL